MSSFCYAIFIYEQSAEQPHAWKVMDSIINKDLYFSKPPYFRCIADQMLRLSQSVTKGVSKHPEYSVHWRLERVASGSRTVGVVVIAGLVCQPDTIQTLMGMAVVEHTHGMALNDRHCATLSTIQATDGPDANRQPLSLSEIPFVPWKQPSYPKSPILTRVSHWWRSLCGTSETG